jgi:hypothetical protein
MTLVWRPGLRLVGAGAAILPVFVALLGPVAHAAAAPRITATSHAPLVAAAGDRIAVTATVVGTGKRIVIGLVFGRANGAAQGGLGLGAGITWRHHGTRRLVVPGRVPATVTRGALGTLLVCIDPAGAVRGGGSCRSAGRIATSGTSAQERIAGARQAGHISSANAILYGLFDLIGGKRVPPELRGGLNGPGGEEAPLALAAKSFGSLPLAVRREALPYFVPPSVAGSAWQVPGRSFPLPSAVKASAAAAAPADCTGYDTVEQGTGPKGPGQNPNPWSGIPTSDGNAIVWYETTQDPKFNHIEAVDRASAQLYARELPKIWSTLTKEFGRPKSDTKEVCYHGPDGRLDVYVGEGLVSINSQFARSTLAITAPYPASGNYPTPGKFCTDRPAWIMARAGLRPWAIAHEFMHVVQFSHRYLSCDDPISWWDEGGATWAGDFVYPDDNTEHTYPGLVADPLKADLVNTDYPAWPFWMMLQRTLGTGVLRSIFAQLKTKGSVPAVNAAISGGYAKQIPRFYLSVWNQSPVGDAGFAIPQSFNAWDKWNQTPAVPATSTLTFNTLPANTLLLPIQRTDGFPALSVGAYHRVDIPDDKIKQLTFTNDLAGKPGAHVDAMLHLADGSWKLADWTGMKTVKLCRDKPAENVRDMVIVSTNTSTHPLGAFFHTLLASNTCPLPTRYDGSWTRVVTDPSRGSWQETIHGTASFVRPSYDLFPQFLDSQTEIPYQVTSAHVTWTVAGSSGLNGCVTYNGGGTETPAASNPSVGDTNLGIEDVSGRTPSPEPKPFYYSINATGSGDQNPDPNRAYDVVNHCDPQNPYTATDYVSPIYLHIGYATTYPNAPPDQIVKSPDATPLAGHSLQSGANPGDIAIDDTWSFAGSG